MPVYQGSRYAGVSVTVLKTEGGRTIRYLHTRVPKTQRDLVYPAGVHSLRLMQDLDEIAFKVGGLSRKWWLLADVNEVFDAWAQADGEELEPGTRLIIPSVDDFKRV